MRRKLMSTQYNSSLTPKKTQRECKTHGIEWIKALTPLDPFQSHFGSDWFDGRLIYSWLAYRGNLAEPQPSSINQISKALLIGARAVKRLLKQLVAANLAESSTKGWIAKEPPEGWFRTFENEHGKGWYDSISYLKLYLPAPGKMIGDRRWGITHCLVWSLFLSLRKKNKINCFASQAAAMLGVNSSTARRILTDFEKGGLIARKKIEGKPSQITLPPLNGHASLFARKTPKPTETKPEKTERGLAPEIQAMANQVWRCEADYLTWENELRIVQQRSANGVGSFPSYRDEAIRRAYKRACPIINRLESQVVAQVEPPKVVHQIGWGTCHSLWKWATEEQVNLIFEKIDAYFAGRPNPVSRDEVMRAVFPKKPRDYSELVSAVGSVCSHWQ